MNDAIHYLGSWAAILVHFYKINQYTNVCSHK